MDMNASSIVPERTLLFQSLQSKPRASLILVRRCRPAPPSINRKAKQIRLANVPVVINSIPRPVFAHAGDLGTLSGSRVVCKRKVLTPGHVLLGGAQMRGCGCPAAVVSPEGHFYEDVSGHTAVANLMGLDTMQCVIECPTRTPNLVAQIAGASCRTHCIKNGLRTNWNIG